MIQLRSDYQEIIKVQSRGLITIPRRFRDRDFGENSFVRVKKEGGKLVLEPVQVIGYSARKYTDREVGEFFDLDDKESAQLRRKGILQ